jgi:hypothetical protein
MGSGFFSTKRRLSNVRKRFSTGVVKTDLNLRIRGRSLFCGVFWKKKVEQRVDIGSRCLFLPVFFLLLALSLEATENSIGTDTSWNDGVQWSLLHFPDGTESANISANVTISSSTGISGNNYSGNLTLNEGATLSINPDSHNVLDHLPSVTTSNIFLHDGSRLYFRNQGGDDILHPIVLFGDVEMETYWSGVDLLGPISGDGKLTIKGQNGVMVMAPSSPSSYTGGTLLYGNRTTQNDNFYANADNTFGVREVTLTRQAILYFNGTTSDVIHDGAQVFINSSSKIDLNSRNETVQWLYFDDVLQNTSGVTDTWGHSSSSANNTNDSYFGSGTGVLTVTGSIDDDPPLPDAMSFAADPSGNGLTAIVMTATTAIDVNPVQYIFENVTTGGNSGYQSGTTYNESGLVAGNTYTYRVRARDSFGNETAWSGTVSTTPSVYNTFNAIASGNSWNTAGSWDLGYVPTGSETAAISANTTVNSSVSFATDYTGDLVLNVGSSFRITTSSHDLEDHIPTGGASKILLYDDTYIEWNNQGGADINIDLLLYGGVEIYTYWTGVDYLGQISGSGNVRFRVNNGASLINPSSPNTYTGGTLLQGNRTGSTDSFSANGDGSFGTGDVRLQNQLYLNFNGTTSDVIDDGAQLLIYDTSRLDLNSRNETIEWLYFEGVVQNTSGVTDTWGHSSSSANNTNDTYFNAGTGVLTVTGAIDDHPPIPDAMRFAVVPSGNGLTSIVMTATTGVDANPVQYIFENVTTGGNSGYQSSTVYNESGLVAGNTYTYRVRARDSIGNETAWSDSYSTTPTIYNTFLAVASGNNWNTAGSWDQVRVPTGGDTAAISANSTVYSSASFATDYTGDLILNEGSSLRINPDSHDLEDHIPAGGASKIKIYDDTYIEWRNQGGADVNKDIILYGGIEIYTYWSGVDYLGQISGSGNIRFTVHNGSSTLNPSSPNTYTGGTILYGNRASNTDFFNANANGAFGAGNVTLAGTQMRLTLGGTTADVIDDDAIFYITNSGQLYMNSNNETVKMLFIDGIPQKAGTYGSTTSPAEFQNNTYFNGSGVLTVRFGPPTGLIIRID